MTKEEIYDDLIDDPTNGVYSLRQIALTAMQLLENQIRAEYATQEKQGWVKCSERLPENDPKAEYVVMGRYDVKEFAIFHDGVFEFYDSESGSYYKFDAIWWMPLPQKPEV